MGQYLDTLANGFEVGSVEGADEVLPVGLADGFQDGLNVGRTEGVSDGTSAICGFSVGFTDGSVMVLNVGLDVVIEVGSVDGECDAVGCADGEKSIGSVVGVDDTIVEDGGATVGEVWTGALVSKAGGLVSIDTGGIGPLGALDGTSLGESLGTLLGN
jgi:hypothetical protein